MTLVVNGQNVEPGQVAGDGFYDTDFDGDNIVPDKWWGQIIVFILSIIVLIAYAVIWSIERITGLEPKRIVPHS